MNFANCLYRLVTMIKDQEPQLKPPEGDKVLEDFTEELRIATDDFTHDGEIVIPE